MRLCLGKEHYLRAFRQCDHLAARQRQLLVVVQQRVQGLPRVLLEWHAAHSDDLLRALGRRLNRCAERRELFCIRYNFA